MSFLRTLPVSRRYPARAIRVLGHPEALVLRPTCMTDVEEIVSAIQASLPELRAFMPWAHVPQTHEAQLDRLRAGEAKYVAGEELVMGLFRGDTFVAMVGLHPRVALNPNGLEIGYWASTPHAGKGYVTLAVRMALLYAFDKLGADRVQVGCDETNLASRRVIEKCGFAFEGVQRNILAAATPELVAGGFRGTARNPSFALFPDTIEAQPWVAELRPRLVYENLAGHEVRSRSSAASSS
ncbi:MAG: GNAT family protein [Polyangiaceae bacterium]